MPTHPVYNLNYNITLLIHIYIYYISTQYILKVSKLKYKQIYSAHPKRPESPEFDIHSLYPHINTNTTRPVYTQNYNIVLPTHIYIPSRETCNSSSNLEKMKLTYSLLLYVANNLKFLNKKVFAKLLKYLKSFVKNVLNLFISL